jgi:hypothetical protein
MSSLSFKFTGTYIVMLASVFFCCNAQLACLVTFANIKCVPLLNRLLLAYFRFIEPCIDVIICA